MTAAVEKAFEDLRAHHWEMKGQRLRDLFAEDPDRFQRFSLRLDDLLLDYSKNLILPETLEKLLALARAADVEGGRDAMFAGEKINVTEGRAVLHTALRNRSERPVLVDGHDVMGDVREVPEKRIARPAFITSASVPKEDCVLQTRTRFSSTTRPKRPKRSKS